MAVVVCESRAPGNSSCENRQEKRPLFVYYRQVAFVLWKDFGISMNMSGPVFEGNNVNTLH